MSTVSQSTLPLPYPFGTKWVLFDRIGAGGMAEIFLARAKTQVGASKLAVVKLVLPNLASDERFSALLVAEAKLAAQLSHANVVQTFDLGREQGRLYIAMEYVEGFDLNELLKRCSKSRVPLPAEFALFIVGETLRALDYAHRKRDPEGRALDIVHRDVSPSNVLISFEGEVKLCDFGIARAISSHANENEPSIEGKASYMSPEHARGDSIDGRADVFSVSVILWELLAGRRLYKPGPGVDLLALARAAEVPELPDRPLPDLDRLRGIVRRGLAKSPADRYPTALAMARELDDYVMANRLMASPLKLGDFLVEHFAEDILSVRRDRERAADALERGPSPVSTTEETSTLVAPPPTPLDDDTNEPSATVPAVSAAKDEDEVIAPTPSVPPRESAPPASVPPDAEEQQAASAEESSGEQRAVVPAGRKLPIAGIVVLVLVAIAALALGAMMAK